MPDRRKFLKSAAALSAAPFAVPAAFAGQETNIRFDAFVFDDRHSEARAFGARADQAGIPTRGFAGDITELWQQDLLGRWRQGPGALAGLTERPALFLLEQLGLEHGLGVVYQAEHEPALTASATHRLVRGGDAGLRSALAAAGRLWPLALADALLGATAVNGRNVGPSDAAMAANLAERDRLYSWIIAPRSAA